MTHPANVPSKLVPSALFRCAARDCSFRRTGQRLKGRQRRALRLWYADQVFGTQSAPQTFVWVNPRARGQQRHSLRALQSHLQAVAGVDAVRIHTAKATSGQQDAAPESGLPWLPGRADGAASADLRLSHPRAGKPSHVNPPQAASQPPLHPGNTRSNR